MSTGNLEVKVQLSISKPVHEVFEAIVDPYKMSGYFISSGTDRMETGRGSRAASSRPGAGRTCSAA